MKIIKQIHNVLFNPREVYKSHKIRYFIDRQNYKGLADYLYYLSFNKKINWKNPEDLNQWINYIAFNTDTSIWSTLADKYRVRKYIEEKGFGDLLIPLLAKWDSPNDIVLDNLPSQFVMKLNNGSGDVVIVKDKNSTNVEELKNTFAKYLQKDFGKYSAEPHYLRIKPAVIAEQYLKPEGQIIKSTSLVDFKFWCFNGEVISCFVVSDRSKESYTCALYDVKNGWKDISEGNIIYSDYRKRMNCNLPRPKSLERMIEVASFLSKGFPQMRVDFYEVNNKLYFGEITMTSTCGRMNYYSDDYLTKMGGVVKDVYCQLYGFIV